MARGKGRAGTALGTVFEDAARSLSQSTQRWKRCRCARSSRTRPARKTFVFAVAACLQPAFCFFGIPALVSISAAHGKADCWQVSRCWESFENHIGHFMSFHFSTFHLCGLGVPASGVWHSGSVSGLRLLQASSDLCAPSTPT